MRPLSTCSVLACVLLLASCNRSAPGEGGRSAGKPATLQGAGATFPYPLYSRWIAAYTSIDSRVRINYQSIGSGGGIRQLLERTVDFGASDVPMTDAELAKAPAPILHVPTTLGAVAVTYNVPDLEQTLRLTPDVLAGIYLGRIRTWNDPALSAVNPGVKLPDQPITVVYRSDGSGTTGVFTEYLSLVHAEWKQQVGAGKSVAFPVGLGAKGNEGVAGQVKTTPGALGYMELAYAVQSGLPAASVRNRAGSFVPPGLAGISAAAASLAKQLPDDLRLSIVDAPGVDAYPISSFSYILVYEQQPDQARGVAMAQFLWWALHEGQAMGPALHYAPLPAAVVARADARLRRLYSGPQALLAPVESLSLRLE